MVGLGECEVPARSISPVVPSSAPSELGTDKLALAKYVCKYEARNMKFREDNNIVVILQ